MQTFAPGMVLRGRYRLESVLGRGVMGQVWQGRDLYLERPVAVKTVASELLAVPRSRDEALARFVGGGHGGPADGVEECGKARRRVIWEVEPGRRVLPAGSLPDASTGHPPVRPPPRTAITPGQGPIDPSRTAG